MDLSKNGKLLRSLRQEKGMTQKQLADSLGVVPKTVSKWETGHGFPDVSTLSALADILAVSERSLLAGEMQKNKEEAGNMKRMKFYVCPDCGNAMQVTGECQIICCGKRLEPLQAKAPDDGHKLTVTEVEDEWYIKLSHEMSKEHYVAHVWQVGYDRTLCVRLY